MNKLKSKLKSKKGFTLIEMLIVVAIIAILVAIAVPVVNASLEEARVATDDANLRTAKTVASVEVIDGGVTDGQYFNAEEGKFQTDKDGAYTAKSNKYTGYIKVKVTGDSATVDWSAS